MNLCAGPTRTLHTSLSRNAIQACRPRSARGVAPPAPVGRRALRCTAVAGAAVAAAPVAAAGFWPVLVQAFYADPVGVMLGVGSCLAATALSVLLVAAVPALVVRAAAMLSAAQPRRCPASPFQPSHSHLHHLSRTSQALARSARAMEQLLHVVRQEVPDTAAAVRLTGLEIADAVEEVSGLGSDLTQGIRASARAIVDVEQGVRQGVGAAGAAVHATVTRGVPAARGAERGWCVWGGG